CGRGGQPEARRHQRLRVIPAARRLQPGRNASKMATLEVWRVVNTTRIGTRLGRYRIDALLGHGRSGTVYDALDTESGREVALTLIEPPAGADAAYRERFRNEARRAAALDHPNIAQLHEAGEIDGELFAAAEYVD